MGFLIKVLLLCCLLCASAWSQITHVNSYSNASASGTDVTTLSVTATVGAGCTTAPTGCAILWSAAVEGLVTPTITFAYSGAGCPAGGFPTPFTATTNQSILFASFATNLSAGTCQITVNASVATPIAIEADTYTGLPFQYALETYYPQSLAGQTGGTAVTSASFSITTNGPSDLIYSSFNIDQCGTCGTLTATLGTQRYNAVTNGSSRTIRLGVWDTTGGPATYTQNWTFTSTSRWNGVMFALRSGAPTFGWLFTTVSTQTNWTITIPDSATIGDQRILDLRAGQLHDTDPVPQVDMPLVSDACADTMLPVPAASSQQSGSHLLYFYTVSCTTPTITVQSQGGSAFSQQFDYALTGLKGFSTVAPVANATMGYSTAGGNIATYQPITAPTNSYMLYSSVLDEYQCQGDGYSPTAGFSQVYSAPDSGLCVGGIYNAMRGVAVRNLTGNSFSITWTKVQGNGPSGQATTPLLVLSANTNTSPHIAQLRNAGGVVGNLNCATQTYLPVKIGELEILALATSGPCNNLCSVGGTQTSTWTRQLGGGSGDQYAIFSAPVTSNGVDQVSVACQGNCSCELQVIDNTVGVGPKNSQNCGSTLGPCSDNGITVTLNNSLVEAFALIGQTNLAGDVTSNVPAFYTKQILGSHNSNTLNWEQYLVSAGSYSNNYTISGSPVQLAAAIISFGPSSSTSIVQPIVNLITMANPIDSPLEEIQ